MRADKLDEHYLLPEVERGDLRSAEPQARCAGEDQHRVEGQRPRDVGWPIAADIDPVATRIWLEGAAEIVEISNTDER